MTFNRYDHFIDKTINRYDISCTAYTKKEIHKKTYLKDRIFTDRTFL